MITRPGWGLALALVLAAGRADAQQSTIQVAGAAQVLTGDQSRLGGQQRYSPDLAVTWYDRGTRLGPVRLDFGATGREGEIVPGRVVLSFDELRLGGLTWSISGGDVATRPVVRDFSLQNLFAPDVTYQGGAIHAANRSVSLHAAGGQFTVMRNIFGSDLIALDETVYQGEVTLHPSAKFEAFGRGSWVRIGDLGAYSSPVDESRDVGGGVRWRPSGAWQFTFDASASTFRRHDSPDWERGPSGLAGILWNAARGWFQIDVYRFTAGRFAATNYPYSDREGGFVSGEIDLGRAVRAYAGLDVGRSNLDPEASVSSNVSQPPTTQSRVFGEVRLRLTDRSSVNLRAESGARVLRPSATRLRAESDTGVWSVEFHDNLPRGNLFARYERRENVDVSDPTGVRVESGSTQQNVYSQFYRQSRRGAQVFASALYLQTDDRPDGGQINWQAGGGAQYPFANRYLRVEALLGRTKNLTTGVVSPRQTLSAGFSGLVAPRTYLSFDVFLEHALQSQPNSNPWMTRSMIRLTHTISYGVSRGSTRAAGAPISGPTGSVEGAVFVDWNGNGTMDATDTPAPGVAVKIGRIGSVASGNDGRFGFARVPTGPQNVTLDAATVPADYDPPVESNRTVVVDRRNPATVAFGLRPVGAVDGAVYLDADGDGQLGSADQPVNDALVVLDDGGRTGQVRAGRFHFGGVPTGAHTVSLLLQSLPDDSQLTGPATLTVTLTREALTPTVTFLLKLEKRPEIRKVYPEKKPPQPVTAQPASAPLQPVEVRQLQQFFPDLPGWKKESPGGEKRSDPVAFSVARVVYTNGASRVDARIVDTLVAETMRAPARALTVEGSARASGDGVVKAVRMGGNPGWQVWDAAHDRAEVGVIVADRFLVSFRGRLVSELAVLEQFVGRMDLARLAALK